MNHSITAVAIANALGRGAAEPAFESGGEFWMEEETVEQARERMTPAERAADLAVEFCHVRHAGLPFGSSCPACGEE